MIEFFDGETVDNKYVLIGNSETYLLNKNGLSSKECLNFLYNNAKKYNYFFRIDYDVNMIFYDIDKETLLKLFNNEPIEIYGYKIQYFRKKFLSINRKYFYDISNFFNTSFLRTLEILEVELTEKEKRFIDSMKKERNVFDMKDIETIIEYNKLECVLGKKIVDKIYKLLPKNLKTYKLYGSSALTKIFIGERKIRNELFNQEIFKSAYHGGRMECFKIGTYNNLYKYDINSAYPSVIKDLRYCENAILINEKPKTIINENLYYISGNNLTNIGMLPVKLKSGYIVFPKNFKGWYYGIEINAVKDFIKFDCDKYIEVKLGNMIFGNEIESLYKKRLEYKSKNDLKHLIYKILLNSIYGKFAQQVGKSEYQNFYLAGYITATTRARLIEAVKNNLNDVIFFATDGILTKKRLKLKIDNNLGNFEEIKIKKAIVILSGVYKLITDKGKVIRGERGYKFDIDKVIKDISKKYFSEVKQSVFITNVYAYKNYKKFLKYRCKFVEIVKFIDIKNQIKRKFNSFDINKENHSKILIDIDINKLNEIPNIFRDKDELDLLTNFDELF